VAAVGTAAVAALETVAERNEVGVGVKVGSGFCEGKKPSREMIARRRSASMGWTIPTRMEGMLSEKEVWGRMRQRAGGTFYHWPKLLGI
jgi:hypothetical protein